VRRAAPAQAEGCLALTVTDTGCGMDAATRERIFEPFFTTKAAGQGTGLGLSTVYGIVQQAGGHITVESESGRGTTFTIYLPRSDDAAQPVRESPAAAARKLLAGTETILIAEDETSVRQLAEQVLRSHGYTVLVAPGGAEALRLAAAHEGSIHLLLADVVMPGLGGPQLADRLRELRPATRVLFMSGYTAGAILRGATPDTPAALLEKPFGPDDLARRVREVLDGERS
jgi:CheY-like chemotaxis protein